MSIVDNIIKEPISINDIRNILGEGSVDLYTLCNSDNINKWARHKPLQFLFPDMGISNSSHDSTYDQQYAYGQDYAGRAGGLKDTAYSSSLTASMNIYVMVQHPIVKEYQKVNMLDGCYARLVDFRNYKHVSEYEFTGSKPYDVYLACEVPEVRGSINMQLTLGAFADVNEEGYTLNSSEILGTGYYLGLLIMRPNDTNNANTWQLAGYDFLLITTEKTISNILAYGDSEDWDGLVNVQRIDKYHINIDFTIPKKEDLTNIAAGFDEFVDKKIFVYPIVTNNSYKFLDKGETAVDVMPLTVDADDYANNPFSFTLQKEGSSGVIYTAPTATITCDVNKNSATGAFALNSLTAIFTNTFTSDTNTTSQRITIKKISYVAEYYTGEEGGWQPDFSQGSVTVDTYIELSSSNPSKTWNWTTGLSFIPNHTGVSMRIQISLYAEVSFIGLGVKRTEYYTATSDTITV